METIGNPALWGGFIAFVIAMLALDLGVFHRSAHAVTFKEALGWSVVWISLALVFNAGLWFFYGSEKALEFLAGYLIEKSLSVDNLFVFVVIFSSFAVPPVLQHRVLFWGILGALVLRAVFIVAGAALLSRFHWMGYVFGGILLFTALKLALNREEEEPDPKHSVLYRAFRRLVPTTDGYRESRFLVKEHGRWLATPLLAVLLVVEGTDVIFAVDSIPAIFAVTRDPFLVFTSNIFAILGLRSLYFLLAGMVEKFHYLKHALAVILAFVGVKLCVAGFYKIPTGISLGVIAGVLTLAVVASTIRARRLDGGEAKPATEGEEAGQASLLATPGAPALPANHEATPADGPAVKSRSTVE